MKYREIGRVKCVHKRRKKKRHDQGEEVRASTNKTRLSKMLKEQPPA